MRVANRVLAKLLGALLMIGAGHGAAGEIRVAAASNVAGAVKELAERFESQTDHRIILAFGSTGRHFAQIRNGAPFDLFMAADVERPRRLGQEGVAVPDTRFTYARGILVLWSPRPDYVDADGRVLTHGSFRHLALANPRLAPYGLAARQVLRARGLWQATEGRRVMGKNVSQTFQFVRTGNAELGFVAASQLQSSGVDGGGSRWRVPASLHGPIDQQAVLIRESQPAREFLDFLRSGEARPVFREFGYEVP